jgi:hypothetical protein
MIRDSLTYQQARAEIARSVMRDYSRRQSLIILWGIADRYPHRSDWDASAVSLAYKIAWALLPAGPQGVAQ